jgi:signal transduction histidine kinase
MSTIRFENDALAVQRLATPLAAIGALAVLIVGLSTTSYYATRWPLTVCVVLLAAGLAGGRLGQLAGYRAAPRFAQPLAALGALVVVIWALSRSDVSPRWPLVLAAGILGLGLFAAPLADRIDGRWVLRSAQPMTALVSLGILIYALTTARWWAPRWPLTVSPALLGFGLAGGRLAQLAGLPSGQRLARSGAAATALGVLVWALSRSSTSPRGLLTVCVVLLGLGLVAGPLAQRGTEAGADWAIARGWLWNAGGPDATVADQRRVHRDVHDGAKVRLVELSMKLGRAEVHYRDDPETIALLREVRADAVAALRDLRDLSRGAAPPVLADHGLEAAVRALAARSSSEISVTGRLASGRRVDAADAAAYFVVAESLSNAALHAPGAAVEVRLDERGGTLFVEVTDFGPGGADPRGRGLTGMRQRVEALDGVLHVTSPDGIGTQIEATLPSGR